MNIRLGYLPTLTPLCLLQHNVAMCHGTILSHYPDSASAQIRLRRWGVDINFGMSQ